MTGVNDLFKTVEDFFMMLFTNGYLTLIMFGLIILGVYLLFLK